MKGYNMATNPDSCYLFTAMMKYVLIILVFCGVSHVAMAQRPVPVTIDKVSAGTGSLISIQGSGFGGDASKLAVFFGAVRGGTIVTATDQLIEIPVPAGATYDNISVTNITSGLTGYSKQQFLLSFGGDFGFDLTNLVGPTHFSTEPGLYDQCLCDFNGDGKVDVATSHFDKSPLSTRLSVLTNTGTGAGNVNFSKTSVTLSAASLHIECGDLNGDGKPDLIATERENNRIFIMQNNSGGTVSFMAPQIITLPTGTLAKQIQITDIDLDGRPEIILTDQALISDKIVILVNQSAGAISFAATPVLISAGAFGLDGLAVDDLNGDNRPDIVTSKYLVNPSDILILENTSVSGSISFATSKLFSLPDVVSGIKIGDLDGDGKPDIAATGLLQGAVYAFLNTGTGTSVNFATSPKKLATDGFAFGIDFGDLDGDGKTDIIAAATRNKSITILNNISSTGNLDFQQHIKTTDFINRHVNIGDLDGDGKPDIAVTSIDDVNAGINASKVTVYRNKTCMIPVITPTGPLAVCIGFPLRLFSSISSGVTDYVWRNGATIVKSGATATFFDVTASGTYTVTATAEGGTCSKESEPVAVNVSGTGAGSVSIKPIGKTCVNGTLTLDVNSPITGAQYSWTGPNGFTANGVPAVVNNFQAANAGKYTLEVVVGTCLYQKLSTVAEIIDVAAFEMTFTGGDVICSGGSKSLSVENKADFSYQWFKDNVSIGGATTNAFTANTAGKFSVKINYTLSGSCPEAEPFVNLKVVAVPVAQFTRTPAGAQVCANENITFSNTSTTDPQATPVYEWKFGDGATSAEKNPVHKYITANPSRTIELKVSYGDCSNTITSSVEITPSPTLQIFNPDAAGVFNFCDGDSIRLAVTGAFDSFLWNNGEQTSIIYAKEGGRYSIDAKATSGCIISDEQDITIDPAPSILITATPPEINEGESTQLDASGITDFTWTPEETLIGGATIANPIAKPLVTTTYEVTGKDGGVGCPGHASIQVVVKGEPLVNKLKPSSFFSPNADNKNDVWNIDKILDFQQCGVTIYDDKGVKVFEAKPYTNTWDGTFNGRKLPDGVYYYIIRCDGEESKPRTGSITVLR